MILVEGLVLARGQASQANQAFLLVLARPLVLVFGFMVVLVFGFMLVTTVLVEPGGGSLAEMPESCCAHWVSVMVSVMVSVVVAVFGRGTRIVRRHAPLLPYQVVALDL